MQSKSSSTDGTDPHAAEATPPSRQVVLAAAQRLIQEHGYAGLSMRELARHSGLAKATLYHHFHDKSDVVLSVLEGDILVVCDRLRDAAASPGSPAARLRAVVSAYFAVQAERRLVVLNALRESAGLEDQVWCVIRTHRRALLEPIMGIIQDAIDAGQARQVNVEMAVMALFGMIHSFVTHRLLLDDVNLDEDMEEFVLDMFLHALGISPQADGTAPVGETSTCADITTHHTDAR
jgi:AcrR family transcriptional regulator